MIYRRTAWARLGVGLALLAAFVGPGLAGLPRNAPSWLPVQAMRRAFPGADGESLAEAFGPVLILVAWMLLGAAAYATLQRSAHRVVWHIGDCWVTFAQRGADRRWYGPSKAYITLDLRELATADFVPYGATDVGQISSPGVSGTPGMLSTSGVLGTPGAHGAPKVHRGTSGIALTTTDGTVFRIPVPPGTDPYEVVRVLNSRAADARGTGAPVGNAAVRGGGAEANPGRGTATPGPSATAEPSATAHSFPEQRDALTPLLCLPVSALWIRLGIYAVHNPDIKARLSGLPDWWPVAWAIAGFLVPVFVLLPWLSRVTARRAVGRVDRDGVEIVRSRGVDVVPFDTVRSMRFTPTGRNPGLYIQRRGVSVFVGCAPQEFRTHELEAFAAVVRKAFAAAQPDAARKADEIYDRATRKRPQNQTQRTGRAGEAGRTGQAGHVIRAGQEEQAVKIRWGRGRKEREVVPEPLEDLPGPYAVSWEPLIPGEYEDVYVPLATLTLGGAVHALGESVAPGFGPVGAPGDASVGAAGNVSEGVLGNAPSASASTNGSVSTDGSVTTGRVDCDAILLRYVDGTEGISLDDACDEFCSEYLNLHADAREKAVITVIPAAQAAADALGGTSAVGGTNAAAAGAHGAAAAAPDPDAERRALAAIAKLYSPAAQRS